MNYPPPRPRFRSPPVDLEPMEANSGGAVVLPPSHFPGATVSLLLLPIPLCSSTIPNRLQRLPARGQGFSSFPAHVGAQNVTWARGLQSAQLRPHPARPEVEPVVVLPAYRSKDPSVFARAYRGYARRAGPPGPVNPTPLAAGPLGVPGHPHDRLPDCPHRCPAPPLLVCGVYLQLCLFCWR